MFFLTNDRVKFHKLIEDYLDNNYTLRLLVDTYEEYSKA